MAKESSMPIDPTPQGGELTRELPQPEYPEPRPEGEDRHTGADADRAKADAPGDRPRTDPLTGAGEDIAG
jgi:hypothetical protein